MAAAVLHQGFGGLLGGHHAGVGDEVAMDGVRVIEIEDFFREVGAVVEKQIEMGDVAAGVEALDQGIVLGGEVATSKPQMRRSYEAPRS